MSKWFATIYICMCSVLYQCVCSVHVLANMCWQTTTTTTQVQCKCVFDMMCVEHVMACVVCEYMHIMVYDVCVNNNCVWYQSTEHVLSGCMVAWQWWVFMQMNMQHNECVCNCVNVVL